MLIVNQTFIHRCVQEEVQNGIYLLGGLQRVWSNSTLLSEREIDLLRENGTWEKQWVFFRCQMNGIVYQCEKYKRVTARNNCTVTFKKNCSLQYGSIHVYVKVLEGCRSINCEMQNCHCNCDVKYWAIIEILEKHPKQLCFQVGGRSVLKHITRVQQTNELVAVDISAIQEKCVCVQVSSGIWVCHLPNCYERD